MLPLLGLGLVAAAVGSGAVSSVTSGIYPFEQAKFYRKGRALGPPLWVVLHTAEDHELPGEARALMEYAAAGPERQVSWHFAVDDKEATQSVREDDTAFAAGPGNARGIHIEMAGSALQGAGGWQDDYSRRVIENAARLTKEILGRHPSIPPVRVSKAEDILAGKPGVTDHAAITRAAALAMSRNLKEPPWFENGQWRVTTHGDVGETFPWERFFALL